MARSQRRISLWRKAISLDNRRTSPVLVPFPPFTAGAPSRYFGDGPPRRAVGVRTRNRPMTRVFPSTRPDRPPRPIQEVNRDINWADRDTCASSPAGCRRERGSPSPRWKRFADAGSREEGAGGEGNAKVPHTYPDAYTIDPSYRSNWVSTVLYGNMCRLNR